MDLPDVQLLCLEQKDRSLEDHTRCFFDLAYLTHPPDSCLCTLYFVGVNTLTKAKLSGEDHRGSFAAYVEQVLERNGSLLTICQSEEDITSPTRSPETSQPPTMSYREMKHEPTTDGKPEPAASDKPEQVPPRTSDQVCVSRLHSLFLWNYLWSLGAWSGALLTPLQWR